MSELISIISKRDNISEEEAKMILLNAISICRDKIMTYDFPSDIEETWIEETGLEPDILYDVIYDF